MCSLRERNRAESLNQALQWGRNRESQWLKNYPMNHTVYQPSLTTLLHFPSYPFTGWLCIVSTSLSWMSFPNRLKVSVGYETLRDREAEVKQPPCCTYVLTVGMGIGAWRLVHTGCTAGSWTRGSCSFGQRCVQPVHVQGTHLCCSVLLPQAPDSHGFKDGGGNTQTRFWFVFALIHIRPSCPTAT